MLWLIRIFFQKATFYWTKVVKLDPNSYIEAWNWLKTTRRVKLKDIFEIRLIVFC